MFDILLSMLPNEASWKGAILWRLFGTLVVGGLAIFFIWLFVTSGEYTHAIPQ